MQCTFRPPLSERLITIATSLGYVEITNFGGGLKPLG
jgi:hypothetical protein